MRDLERYSRNVRNENRASISTGTGEPSSNEGKDGDIQINTTSGGLKLYAKYQGQWYATGLTKILNKPNKIDTIGNSLLGRVNDASYALKVKKNVGNHDGGTGEGDQTFEEEIITLCAKINEIIEKIQ